MIRSLIQAGAITFGWAAVIFGLRGFWLDAVARSSAIRCDWCDRPRRDAAPVIVRGEPWNVCDACGVEAGVR